MVARTAAINEPERCPSTVNTGCGFLSANFQAMGGRRYYTVNFYPRSEIMGSVPIEYPERPIWNGLADESQTMLTEEIPFGDNFTKIDERIP